VATAVSKRITIPTIGIGSGAGCDGQVLVLHDLLDMHGAESFRPKFVKQFAHIGDAMRDGVKAYADEVRGRGFPAPEHVFAISPEELSAFTTAVEAGSAEDNILADW
jgi:3-methyl-2-oxobutanoate hydroxymethyltransferase